MKRTFSVFLSVIMVLSLVACGGSESEETTTGKNTASNETTIDVTSEKEVTSEQDTTTEELTTKETSSEELSSEEESASDEETSKEDSSEDATTEKNTTEKVTTEKNTTEKNTTEKKTTEKITTQKTTTEKITTKKEETTTKKEEETTEPETTVDYGTGTVTVWVPESIVDTVQSAANKFIASDKAYAGYSVKVEGMGITDTAMNARTDIESTADIYLFLTEQYEILAECDCLTKIEGKYKEYITNNMGEDAVKASKIDNEIYAYPAALQNGYFLYYDKSAISNPNSLEQMIADCEAKGKNFYYNTSNAWYQPAFFFATGCYIDAEYDDELNVTYKSNMASQQGIVALREIAELRDSKCFVDAQVSPFENLGFVISGTWIESDVRSVLGDNFEATKLPEFVGSDGKTYQMSGFSGYGMYGIKPQSHTGKEEICMLLLNHLTSASVQLEVYKAESGYCPVNKEARNNSLFKNNKTGQALMKQSKYLIVQGTMPMDMWYGCGMCSVDATDKEVLSILQRFQCNITGEKMPEEEWVEDDLREKLVEAAIAVRQKYMTENSLDEIIMETGAFYDFNYDGVPEYCLMQADAYFHSSGLVYEYVNGEYVLKGSLTDYESLETYKDAEGNYYNTSYRYWMSTGNHITDEDFNEDMIIQKYKFWDFTNEYFIGTSFEPISSNDVDSPVYYNSSNQEVTKDEFDAIMNSYIQGMTKLRYCGGLRQQIGTAVEENINKAYISYLQKKNYR